MEYAFDRITLFHRDEVVHYAKIEYRKIYGPNRVVELEKIVPAKEINRELGRIIHYYREKGDNSFNINNLIVYRDYIEKPKYSTNQKLMGHIESVENKDFDMMERIRKKLAQENIDVKIGSITLAIIILIGAGYSINKYFKPKETSYTKANKTIGYMVTNPNSVALDDIDEVLKCLDNTDSSNNDEALDNRQLCKKIFNSYRTDSSFMQTILNKFNDFGGMQNLDLMTDNMIEHFCVYGVNLVMGGDNYGHLYNNNKSLIIATNLDELKGKEYYDYVTMIANEYEVPADRVRYAALYSESLMYKNLPPMIKYIILSQTENAVKKIHFEFQKKELIPTWWVELYDKYDYDKLIEAIEAKKDECRKAIYEFYGKEDTKGKGKH